MYTFSVTVLQSFAISSIYIRNIHILHTISRRIKYVYYKIALCLIRLAFVVISHGMVLNVRIGRRLEKTKIYTI